MAANIELGSAYVQIVPSARGIGQKLSGTMSGEMVAPGKAAGLSVASTIKKVIVASGIGVAIGKALKEGAALEQSLGGVETLFKDHADVVVANANKAWKTAGLSANEYMEQSTSFAASLLQSLGGDTQAAAKYADMAIIDMSDNANKMGTSIENIQNAYQGFAKGNYTMLDNLKLGYGGTKTEMERLLKDASEISGVEYNIDNLSDVYDAIHVIQGELGITGTTAKEAAETLSGSFAAMKSAGTNVLGALVTGADVSGPMTELAQSAATFFVNNLVPALGNLGQGITNAMWALGECMSQNMDGITNAASTLISKLVVGLVKNLPKLVGGALAIVGALSTALVNGLGKALGNLGSILVNKINAALGKVKAKIKEWVASIKNYFPFNIGKILSLKIPHISVSGGKAPWGIGGLGVKPTFKVTWNAKGGIFTQPTIIGNQGFGEAGPEAVLPLDTLWSELDKRMSGGTLNLIVQLDGRTIGQSAVEYINNQTITFGASPVMI